MKAPEIHEMKNFSIIFSISILVFGKFMINNNSMIIVFCLAHSIRLAFFQLYKYSAPNYSKYRLFAAAVFDVTQ